MKAEILIDSNQIIVEISREVVKALKPLLSATQDDDLIYFVQELAQYLRVSAKWSYDHTYELP